MSLSDQTVPAMDDVGSSAKLFPIDDPPIDYAMLAKSMGMWAEGPITNPRDLGPALKRAVAVVKRGQPALLDVVTQPR